MSRTYISKTYFILDKMNEQKKGRNIDAKFWLVHTD